MPGKLHFKNKFCDNCRSCIMVPVAHVRALSAEQAACFVNKRSEVSMVLPVRVRVVGVKVSSNLRGQGERYPKGEG